VAPVPEFLSMTPVTWSCHRAPKNVPAAGMGEEDTHKLNFSNESTLCTKLKIIFAVAETQIQANDQF